MGVIIGELVIDANTLLRVNSRQFMEHVKPLYNLLLLNGTGEDFRQLPVETLFSRLHQAKIILDKASFLKFSAECDTPEELAEILLEGEVEEDLYDPLYLVIFELWRRFIPEKQSLSIFGDELDHRISLYNQGLLESDEPIQDALANLLEVLEENTDLGVSPEEIFAAISEFCAHNIEEFLYEYILDLLETGNQLYAEELLEGYLPYCPHSHGLVFLQIRASNEPDRLEELLKEKLDLSLLLDILAYLSIHGEPHLFVTAVRKCLPLLELNQDLIDLLEITAEYYHRLDQETLEQKVQRLLEKRGDPNKKLSPSDADVATLRQMIGMG